MSWCSTCNSATDQPPAFAEMRRLVDVGRIIIAYPQRLDASTALSYVSHSSVARWALLAWFECASRRRVAGLFDLSVKSVETYVDRVRRTYADVGQTAATKANLFEPLNNPIS